MSLETLVSDYCEMEQKHRTILRHYWCDIRDNLEPNNILPKLVLVLGETDEEEIKEQSTRQERCDKLLKILPTRGENAFDVFVNALVKEAPHLAKKLTVAGNKDEPNQSSTLRDRSISKVALKKTWVSTQMQFWLSTPSYKFNQIKPRIKLVDQLHYRYEFRPEFCNY